MLMFLKSTSRTRVNHDNDHIHEETAQEEEQELKSTTSNAKCTTLTVWRKSLVFTCKGFTVIGSDGNLVYRVDNYLGRSLNQIVLMDGSGNPILTMCPRKKLRIVVNWLIYEGDVGEPYETKSLTTTATTTTQHRRPIFSVRKNINIIKNNNNNVLAYVYNGGVSDDNNSSKRCAYMIEGSYTNRACRILDESKRVVAEIKRKKSVAGGVDFGGEVFVLVVGHGFDARFAMALVLLLDQMFS